MSSDTEPKDGVNRVKGSNPAGTATFVGFRCLDPFLQHTILTHDTGPRLLSSITGTTTPFPTNLSSENLIGHAVGLNPWQTIIFSMSVGSSLKHTLWILGISYEKLDPAAGGAIAAFNSVFNSLNTLLFTLHADNPTWSSNSLRIGSALYVTGILTETVAELQRLNFKRNPKNKGKPYSGGLFSLARSINYGGCTLWRTGYALAAGGPIWGAIIFGFFFYNFATQGIPAMDNYCSKKVRLPPKNTFLAFLSHQLT